jgi:phospholipid transport system substrate-binding protein
MANKLTRRTIITALPAAMSLGLISGPARALNVDQARRLIDSLVAEVNTVISSGQSESSMFKSFESIFVRFADVRYIAQSALGPAGRQASKAQMDAYVKSFQGYISRKYGRRFREFIGGRIEVTGARALKSFYEVTSMALLRGQSPFEVRWHVFDKSGRDLFFNIIIEGVNMLAAERTEIGAMLDKRKGDVSKLTADLKALG